MHEVNAKSILSAQNGMNLYRGCSHGCIYCDSRSTCYGMKHDFEDIEVKINAPQLLEAALRSKRKKCMIGTGVMSDPYLPLENKLGLTRKCLELIEYYGFGAALQTKSDLVLRDLDLLKKINERTKCVVQMTLTTADEELCRILEPHVCTTKKRAEVLNILREEGIPTVVWFCPVLPFINDTEENVRGIMDYAVRAKAYGVLHFGMGVTLRDGDRQYFYEKLEEHFPGLRRKYIENYGNAYEVGSPNEKKLMSVFYEICRKNGLESSMDSIFSYLHKFEEKLSASQMNLFDFMPM
ncbi:radical SAM protein [Blautia pseudococcoides]|uniref:SPL family radical SAM protein n=1 Tax=Blautia pseudococcoides TaxID=1796616 RepID=UPI00148B2C34|nr:radical SAM protein [Blautia pseudococcoides]QJU13227.1 radical SAM protein [Blautia pseudococcoides]